MIKNYLHYNYDKDIVVFLQSHSNKVLDAFFSLILYLTSIKALVLYTIVFFIFYRDKTLKLLKLGIISLIINNILKNIIRRDRPYVSYSDILGKYIDSGTGFSFPSGHAQLMATFLFYIYFSTRLIFIKICCLLALLAVCISRMYFGLHFFTDILAGAFMGLCINLLFNKVTNNT